MEAIKIPFRLSFQVLNFYGFYLADNCKFRFKALGVWIFCFINVQFMLASIYRLSQLKNLEDFIISILYVLFSLNLSFKIISFVWNRKKIIEIIDEFHELERKIDNNIVVKVHEEVEKFVKSSFIMDASIGFILSLLVLILSHGKHFVIPVLYGTDNDRIYYALYALQYVQVLGLGTTSVAVESIFTIFLMLMQAQVDSMRKMISVMVDIKDETVKNFVDFQDEVLRLRDKIQSLYGLILLLQSSIISSFLCILIYKTIQSSFKQNPSDFIYFFGFALVMLSKIALPHVYGQIMITKSDEIINDLYELNWYEKDRSQRKNLAALMTQNQRSLKIRIAGFYDMDLKYLGAIFNAAYSYYSVLKTVSE